ncbi:MAG TPA: class I SAM-dependent methyltransferase [Gammaproteobacteria bacterium]|jgi:16S rRNA (guanine1516-N2)-methyltransferase|nr:class I SAM-dependent methyltransferase [Gammaproteobacteria bacterium]
MKPRIAVTAANDLSASAQQLAAELNLIFIPIDDSSLNQYEFILQLTACRLELLQTGIKKQTPFYIDFLAGKMRYRSDNAGLKRELLARALGAKPKDHPHIIDATAGLGRDSFILATLGYEITLIERSPVVFALLRDAVQRAANDPAMSEIVRRMHLIHGDAENYLRQIEADMKPDIIYLDPMFPEREKSASVKKEMLILQHLLHHDTNSDTLLDTALTCSKRRVVVKRPRLAPALSNLAPSYELTGKNSRFDIYLV